MWQLSLGAVGWELIDYTEASHAILYTSGLSKGMNDNECVARVCIKLAPTKGSWSWVGHLRVSKMTVGFYLQDENFPFFRLTSGKGKRGI